MDHAVSWGMDQGMDRGVWIVCGSGALIHTLYFDSYPLLSPETVNTETWKVQYQRDDGGMIAVTMAETCSTFRG